jgi:hypothetical protein
MRLELAPRELPLAQRFELDLVVGARFLDPPLDLCGLDGENSLTWFGHAFLSI